MFTEWSCLINLTYFSTKESLINRNYWDFWKVTIIPQVYITFLLPLHHLIFLCWTRLTWHIILLHFVNFQLQNQAVFTSSFTCLYCYCYLIFLNGKNANSCQKWRTFTLAILLINSYVEILIYESHLGQGKTSLRSHIRRYITRKFQRTCLAISETILYITFPAACSIFSLLNGLILFCLLVAFVTRFNALFQLCIV